ncbi:MAG TPA: PepSY-associated TM helix domain-containing protein, partial [Chthoniobacteraceae bacterium]|nr:PepSY-associated TM helix domain-containing protein [Chthoniobacteraceae bacterium]
LFLVISGVVLWFPRSWTAKAVKAISIPSLQLRGKARDFNWHNAIGIWTAPVLVIIVATGVLISYPWATNLLYRATGNEPPAPKPNAQRPGGGSRENKRDGAAGAIDWSALDLVFPVAAKQFPDWRTISVQLPPSATAPVTFAIERSHRGRPDLKAQVTIDSKTSEIVKIEDFAGYNSGRRLRTWARWLHTGEAGGLGGQIVAALATAGTIVLVVTGVALGFRRFLKRSGSGMTGASVLPENRPLPAESALSDVR